MLGRYFMPGTPTTSHRILLICAEPLSVRRQVRILYGKIHLSKTIDATGGLLVLGEKIARSDRVTISREEDNLIYGLRFRQ